MVNDCRAKAIQLWQRKGRKRKDFRVTKLWQDEYQVEADEGIQNIVAHCKYCAIVKFVNNWID